MTLLKQDKAGRGRRMWPALSVLALCAGCATSPRTSVWCSGEARFGADREGRMTLAVRDDNDAWKEPVPLSAELRERYADLIGREPGPGETVRWQTVESDAWGIDLPAGAQFVSGSLQIGGRHLPLVRVPWLESQIEAGPGSTALCVAPKSWRPGKSYPRSTWVVVLREAF